MMYQKEDRDFFERLILLTNNVSRYAFMGMSDDEFDNYLKRKFRKNILIDIREQMIIGVTPEEISHNIKDLDGFGIAKEYAKLKERGDFIFSFEKKIGKRFCDLVAYNKSKDSLIAFEVKSNGDNIDKAKYQIIDYFQWADEVYLIVDDRKKYDKLISEKMRNKFGIIIYNQKTNKFQLMRKSEKVRHNFDEVKKLIGKTKLKRINRENWKFDLCQRF